MRAFVLLLAAALWCGVGNALVPHEINYQGYLTNAGGTPVNTSVSMVLKLYNASTGGTALYSETQTVTVTNGVFNVLIGSVTALSLPFDVPYWLGITVGADPEMTPRQALAASPYAIRSANTEAAPNPTPQYAYIYNLAAQFVPVEGSVVFDSNGAISSDFSHTPGTTGITIGSAGTYHLAFALSVNEPNQFSLFVNGTPAAGSVYGSGGGTQQNNGQVILALNAGDVVTVVNHSSASAVSLPTVVGGTQANVNASVVIVKLN